MRGDAATTVTRWAPRRWVGGVLVAAAGVLLVGASADDAQAEAAAQQTVRSADVANPLAYKIRTRLNTGGTCGEERTFTGIYGVPSLIDVGGLILPDAIVEVVPVPALPPLTDETVLSVSVVKLSLGSLPIRVEVILSPDGPADPSRVTLGYDACDSDAPATFGLKATSTQERLSISASTLGPGDRLTVLGGTHTAGANNTEVDPTRVAARFEPVPHHLSAAVDFLGESKYAAHLSTSDPSQFALDFLQQSGPKATTAKVRLNDLPEKTDVNFSSGAVAYTSSATIGTAAVDVTSTTTGANTQQVSARLTGLPPSASFQRVADRAVFSTPGVIGSADVRYATFAPGTTLPAVPNNPHQFVHAQSNAQLSVIDLRLLGLRSSTADLADPIRLDLKHTAGPFDLTLITTGDTLTGTVRDLPADVQFSYGRKSQQITYAGSAVIDALDLDFTSTEPIVGAAHTARARIRTLPTGFTATLDKDADTYTVQVAAGRIGKLELQLTGGPNETLDPGADGVELLRRPASDNAYLTFVRLSGIANAHAVLRDDLTRIVLDHHQPGPFVIKKTDHKLKDGEANTRTIDARIDRLPEQVDFAYDDTAHRVDYVGSAPIGELTANVTSNPRPVASRGNHLSVLARNLSSRLRLELKLSSPNDELESVSADTGGGSIGLLELSIDNGVDHRDLLGDHDGLLVVDLKPPAPAEPGDADYHLFARATGLQKITYSEHKSAAGNEEEEQTHVAATLLGGRDIMVNLRKFGGAVPDQKPEPILAKKEGVTYLEAVLHRPPAGINLKVIKEEIHSEIDDERVSENTHIEYRATTPERPADSSLDVVTNKGSGRSKLVASMAPVPATTNVCLSPDLRECIPPHHADYPDGPGKPLASRSSYGFHVSEPVHLTVTDCKESMRPYDPAKLAFCDEPKLPDVPVGGLYVAKLTSLDLQIERRFVVMSATNRRCTPNCKVVNIDTDSGLVEGRIKKESAGYTANGFKNFNTDLSVKFPAGFRAADRIVQINCKVGCHGEHVRGRVACPAGLSLTADTVLGDLNFAQEFCPKPKLTAIDPAALPRGSTNTSVEITGSGFSPSAIVSMGSDITVHEVEWLDYDRIRVRVTIEADASPGKRDVTVINPGVLMVDKLDDAFTVTP